MAEKWGAFGIDLYFEVKSVKRLGGSSMAEMWGAYWIYTYIGK